MKFNILLINFIIGVLGVISYTHAIPIKVVYTGDTCDCPKNLNYLVHVPPPPKSQKYKTIEYGYKLDVPPHENNKVIYSFDFTVLEPKAPPPLEQTKLNLYAKIDRITAHKKDCYTPIEEPISNTCDCNRCAIARNYANENESPENSGTRYTRNLKEHPNSIDYIKPSTSQILAIFLEPLQQTTLGASKLRNKRNISRIFLRPRKNGKRSNRLIKQYKKPLTDQVRNKEFLKNTTKSIRSRSITSPTQVDIRPLHQLKSFLNLLQHLRNKRDIKGEYDLIEQDREKMDLTLPEIIQYMPETLNPNFKRGQCQFSPLCKNMSTKSSTEFATTTETTTIATLNEVKETTQTALDNAETNRSSNDPGNEHENRINSTYFKRNTVRYGGHPLDFNNYNTTSSSGYMHIPLTNFEAITRSFESQNSPYRLDPAPQLYVGVPHNPYAQPYLNNAPLEGAAHGNSIVQTLTKAQLDQIISKIISKHTDFIETSSHRDGELVDPI